MQTDDHLYAILEELCDEDSPLSEDERCFAEDVLTRPDGEIEAEECQRITALAQHYLGLEI